VFTQDVTVPAAPHPHEPHRAGLANRLNWLRAGVLGANDGIVSVAALAVGVASATPRLSAVLIAVLAGLVGGAISMAAGEYVSVSSQSDSERALIAKERKELAEMPHEELAELTNLYERKGLSAHTAKQVATELTQRDALAAHLDAELNIDPHDIVSPWRAALASAVAFTVGGLLPLVAILIFRRIGVSPPPSRLCWLPWESPVHWAAISATVPCSARPYESFWVVLLRWLPPICLVGWSVPLFLGERSLLPEALVPLADYERHERIPRAWRPSAASASTPLADCEVQPSSLTANVRGTHRARSAGPSPFENLADEQNVRALGVKCCCPALDPSSKLAVSH